MTISLLDLFFPKKCVSCKKLGGYICKSCFLKIEFLKKPVCPVCQRQAIGGKTHPGCLTKYSLDGLIVACKYKGPVRDAIKSVKYKWQFDVASVLVNLLVFNIWRFSLNKDLVMVPIPLYKNREKWRGFNQAAKLTQLLSEKFNHKYVFLMERVKNTKTQVGLSRKQRKSNIKGAFIVSSGFKIRGKEFLLVDDVYTSGATMAEACRVLKKAGAKEVWGMVVALG